MQWTEMRVPARAVWDAERDRTHLLIPSRPPHVLSGTLGQLLHAYSDGGISAPRTTRELARLGVDRDRLVAVKVPPGPHLRRLQIEVSLLCNLHCAYCFSNSGPSRREGMTDDEIERLIDQAHDIGVLAVDFTGGEFLMNPSWAAHVARARSHGMTVTVHTNGTLITDDAARALKAMSVAAVQVSLDSHHASINDAIRGRGALRRALAGIKALTGRDIRVRVALMAHQRNVATLGDTIAFLRDEVPAVSLTVDRVVKSSASVGGDALSNAEFWNFIRPLLSPTVEAGRICESSAVNDYEPECGVGHSYMYITASGEYAICPTMTSREHASFTGPSVSDMSLAEAWTQGEVFVRHRNVNCSNVTTCPSGRSCGGGCRSNAYVDGGTVDWPDTVACNVNKNPGVAFVDFPSLYVRTSQMTETTAVPR